MEENKEKKILIPPKYFEIINYFIKHNNEEQQCQEVGNFLYPNQSCKPKEKDSTIIKE